MNIETKMFLFGMFCVLLLAFVALRTADGSDGPPESSETSVRCVKLNGNWQEPHGISPGWCKR